MIFDLIGIPFLKAGNNDTPFVVYQNDFKEILMKQPIAICFARPRSCRISRTDMVVLVVAGSAFPYKGAEVFRISSMKDTSLSM